MMAVGTMKRKLKWTAVVVAVLLLGVGAALLLWPRDRITRESWEKIRIGMTVAEVEDILGGPGIPYEDFLTLQDRAEVVEGHFSIDEPKDSWVPMDLWKETELANTRFWLGGRGTLGILFDRQRKVASKVFVTTKVRDPNFIDRLRDWLGW